MDMDEKKDKPETQKQRKAREKKEAALTHREGIIQNLKEHGFPVTDEAALDFIEGYFNTATWIQDQLGRPSKYDERMDDWAILLGARGYSLAQIAFIFGVSRDTLYEWGRKNQSFSDALARARDASQNWWEIVGQSSLFAERFNSFVWNKIVSSRFRRDYTDRKGLPYNPAEPETIEAAAEVMQLDPRDLTEEQREILRIAIEAAKIQETE